MTALIRIAAELTYLFTYRIPELIRKVRLAVTPIRKVYIDMEGWMYYKKGGRKYYITKGRWSRKTT